MTQWEYREDIVPVGRQTEHLADRGLQGWELTAVLVATMPTTAGGILSATGPQPALVLIFKRPVGDGPDDLADLWKEESGGEESTR